MKNQFTLWRTFLLLGIILSLTSSCAPPALEVFLSPNPDFTQSSTTQTTTPQHQQQLIPVQPSSQGMIVQAATVQPTVVDYAAQSPMIQTLLVQPGGENSLVLQLNETMREAETLVFSGEARLQEQNPLEAIREFERARLLLDQDFAPTLQHIEQQSLIQAGIGILSQTELQRFRNQQNVLMARINQSFDLQALYEKKAAEEKFETLRRMNKIITYPIATAASSSSRVMLQPRLSPQITPATSWLNVSWIPADEIERSIEHLQKRTTDFRSCLARANQHFPQVTSILLQESVPQELAYIALIESGYQPSARSSSGEAGLWQLSKSVAQSYGLKVSSSSDERLSVAASTRAFARYMRDLRQQYYSWELAILAYHLGRDALRGAMNYTGSSDPQMLVNYSSTARSYLARLAASMIIANNPAAYGFDGTLASMSGQYAIQTGGQYSGNTAIGMFEPPVNSLY